MHVNKREGTTGCFLSRQSSRQFRLAFLVVDWKISDETGQKKVCGKKRKELLDFRGHEHGIPQQM